MDIFNESQTISNKRFIFRILLILLALSISVGVCMSIYAKNLAVKNLAHSDMEKTSELVFEVIYSKMKDGWDREDLISTISDLNKLKSGMDIKSHRSRALSEQYGYINTALENDPELMRAFMGEEKTVISDNSIRFLYPVKNEAKCIKCHSNIEIGGVNGVIDISMPLTKLMIPLDEMIRYFMLLLIFLLIIVFIIIYLVLNRKFIKPMSAFSKNIEKICPYDKDKSVISIDSNISEIKKVERSFNKLLDKYSKAIVTLQENEELILTQSRHAAMGEMISMIAHQWRQPISAISMNANNILADIELETLDEDSLNEDAKNIVKQTQELSKVIDDFRSFFRPDKQVEEVFVEDVFDEVFAIMGKSLEYHNIKIEKEFNYKEKINTHSRELMQVFINIIKNSKEAIEENGLKRGFIKLSTDKDKDGIVIKICDNGGGIEEKIINRVFDPYFTTKNENIGTGIGLYMSKIIVEKHLGGRLEMKNLEDGVCFIVSLPKKGDS